MKRLIVLILLAAFLSGCSMFQDSENDSASSSSEADSDSSSSQSDLADISDPTPSPPPTEVPEPEPTQVPENADASSELVEVARIRINEECEIIYFGPLEVVSGQEFTASFRVFCAGEFQFEGEAFFATLGDPPTDALATHGQGTLDEEGWVLIDFGVNWAAGETKLWASFQEEVYEITLVGVSGG